MRRVGLQHEDGHLFRHGHFRRFRRQGRFTICSGLKHRCGTMNQEENERHAMKLLLVSVFEIRLVQIRTRENIDREGTRR